MPDVLSFPVDGERLRTHRHRMQLFAILIPVAAIATGTWLYLDGTANGNVDGGRGFLIVLALIAGPVLGLLAWLVLVRRIDSGMRAVVVVPPDEVRHIERRLRLDESGHGGLGFRYSRPLTWYLVLVAVAWSVPGWALLARGDLVLALIAGLVFLVPLITVLRRGFRRGVLVLTPELVLHRTWGFDQWAPWREAAFGWSRDPGVPKGSLVLWPRAPDQSKRYRYRVRWPSIVARRITPLPALTTGYFGAHPVVVGDTMVFYGLNPELRGELGTEAAVDRVRHAVESAR